MMTMKSKGTYYYVRVYDEDDSILAHAYTDNVILLKLFCESIRKNRAINNVKITYDEFDGRLGDFYITIKKHYGLYITGEDIITTFRLDIPYVNKTVEVLSTCNIMYAGFPDYARRKLLPKTQVMFHKNVLNLALFSIIGIRDEETKELIIAMHYILIKYAGKLSFFDSIPENMHRTVYDDVYGLMKGWYIPL